MKKDSQLEREFLNKAKNRHQIDQLIAQQKYKSESTRIDLTNQMPDSSSSSRSFKIEQRSNQKSEGLQVLDSKPHHLPNSLSGDFQSIDQLKSHREMLGQQLEMLDYSKVIVPVNIGCKYRPPKIGIEFYLKNDEKFDQSLSSKRGSVENLLINDIDKYSQQLLVHEIHLDRFFFTKEAQIHGERSYDRNRENSHASPMKNQLSAEQIVRQLYQDRSNYAFLNQKIIKVSQIQRLVQKMMDKYQNFFKERTPSRERAQYPLSSASPAMAPAALLDTTQERIQKQAQRKNEIQAQKAAKVEESLGLRDPLQNLEADLADASNSNLSSKEKSQKLKQQQAHDFSNPQFINQKQFNRGEKDTSQDFSNAEDVIGKMQEPSPDSHKFKNQGGQTPPKSNSQRSSQQFGQSEMTPSQSQQQQDSHNYGYNNQQTPQSMGAYDNPNNQMSGSQGTFDPNMSLNSQNLQNTHLSIDINDSMQLEAQGLKRVQIEGFQSGTSEEENQEFLMDQQGNIYDLNGNFVATMDDNEEEEGASQNQSPSQQQMNI